MNTQRKLRVRAADVDTQALLRELRRWVDIESPTADDAAVNRMADHVESLAGAAGLTVTRTAGTLGRGDLLTVRHGQAPMPHRKGVLILAHLDTVHALGTLGSDLPWREDGSRIYGPGIYDMKSGSLMALEALRLARACGEGPQVPVTILYVPDEEMGSRSSRTIIEAEARNALFVLVAEPAREGGKVVTARRGAAIYEIVVTGRAAHAGTRPQDGRSAIRAAAKLVLELEALNDSHARISVSVGTISGGTTRNTIPAECRLQLDVRLPDAAASDRVIPLIEGLKSSEPDISVEVSGGITRPAFAPSEAGDRLFSHAARYASQLGYTLTGMTSGGGSDGNFAASLGVPTLDGLGADGEGAHTLSECIFPESIAARTALIANLLLDTAFEAQRPCFASRG